MKKNSYYFPHFYDALNDIKLRRIRKELGIEGYGIYFMTLETLRAQAEFKYPISELDLLADEFGTSENKVSAIVFNYNLFDFNEDVFWSPKLIEFLQPYLKMKEQRRIAGQKSGEARRLKSATSNSRSTVVKRELNENEQSKVNKSKLKETKVNKINNTPAFNNEGLEVIPQTEEKEKRKKVAPKKEKPTREEFVNYGVSKLPEACPVAIGLKYDSWIINDWRDGNNKPVKNWQMKLNNTLPYLPKAQKNNIEKRIETMQQVRDMWQYDENGNLIED